jgi:hypothetical protein
MRSALLQEAMDAKFAEEIAPLLLRGVLRMSSPSASMGSIHTLRWRECKLVLKPKELEQAARGTEPRATGGPESPPRRRQSSSFFSTGTAEPAAPTGETPRPVLLPSRERIPTRQQAEQALLAAERAALDSVQFVCGGSACFGLAQLLSVGQSRATNNAVPPAIHDCSFWVHTSLSQNRFHFRAANPAEQQRWVHALTELARRRIVAQHRRVPPAASHAPP